MKKLKFLSPSMTLIKYGKSKASTILSDQQKI